MMTDAKFREKIESVVHFWDDRMPMMAMEEFAEAIQAISKYERIDRDYKSSEYDADEDAGAWDDAFEHLIEELGDAAISILALMEYYGISETLVQRAVEKKLNKEY